jgi:hypothetical protein
MVGRQRTQEAHFKDFLVRARDAIRVLANSGWWDWIEGSAPAHWKWPEWNQEIIQEALPIWFREAPKKQWIQPQPAGKNQNEDELMQKKLGKVGEWGCVTKGEVHLLTLLFALPKGTPEDARMVYDGTKLGLNHAIWVPRFSFPTVNMMMRAVDENTLMGDMDTGETFLNFILHESMQALCRVDLTEFFGEVDLKPGRKQLLWEKWVCCAMGLKSLPY